MERQKLSNPVLALLPDYSSEYQQLNYRNKII